MRFTLMVPVSFTLDDLADELTRVVWSVITTQASLRRLYPGYHVAIHSVVVGHLHESMVSNIREADGRHRMVFEDSGDLGVFTVKLAGAIVVRLEEVLRQARALDLITREIPGAVHGALQAHVCADAPARQLSDAPAELAVPFSIPV